MTKVFLEIYKDEIEADKNEAVDKAVSNDREDIAKKMLEKKKPLDEIFEFTSVPIARLNELANMLTGTPARS